MPKPSLNPLDDLYLWVVAYIDAKFVKFVDSDLGKFPEYAQVESYIPMIKILKKTFKKENLFEDVPLLFNYGFFKVPRKYALYKDWLEQMRKNVQCIYAWVKDPASMLNGEVATAGSDEIARLLRDSVNMGAHTADEINLLRVGDPIVLRGYPFEGVNATVLEIDHKNKKVNVEIRIFDQLRSAKVSFDNVFFTIYHDSKNFDDGLSDDLSINQMQDNKTFDKFQRKKFKDET